MIVLLLRAACSSGSGPIAARRRSSTAAATDDVDHDDLDDHDDLTTTTTTAPAQPVTIVFAGDINFEGTDGDPPRPRPGDRDRTVHRRSCPVPTSPSATSSRPSAPVGTPENKDFTFQAPPSAVDALRAGGFDAVSMANNHGRDYGPSGLDESLAVKDAQADHFIIGIGHDDVDAYTPFTATVNGQRIAVIAATQVLDDELVAAWTATPDDIRDSRRRRASTRSSPRCSRRARTRTPSWCSCTGASSATVPERRAEDARRPARRRPAPTS